MAGGFTRPDPENPRGGSGFTRGGGDDDFITELGDPNFSPSTSSQGQVPAAAAQDRIFQTQTKASNFLNDNAMMGYDTSGAEFDPIREMAERGVTDAEPRSWIANLVGWIDGPRQAVNLAIQDIVGGAAAEGMRNPGFKDYWGAFWGGVENETQFTMETGLSPVSGSQTLDMFGWSEEDDFWGRVGRGIVDFGLQVLTDPTSYLTFGLSGLGKKAALQMGRGFQQETVQKIVTMAVASGDAPGKSALRSALTTPGALSPYEESLVREMLDGSLIDDFSQTLMDSKAKFGGDFPPDVREALDNYLGDADTVWESKNLMETALANRVFDDVIKPLAGRDFGNINAIARDELALWGRGGARISAPWTKGTLSKGWQIPGTAGLGRALVGKPARALGESLGTMFPKYRKLGQQIDKGINSLSRKRPMLQALAKPVSEGGIEGWQFHLLNVAQDIGDNQAAKHTISTILNGQWNHIADVAKRAGVSMQDVGADVFLRMEGENIDETLKQQLLRVSGIDPEDELRTSRYGFNEELDEAINETVTYMQETMAKHHEALGQLDESFADKFIKGYIPHTTTKPGRKIINSLTGTSAGRTGQGDVVEDLMGMMLNAAGRGGVAVGNMGATRHEGRVLGRLQALQLTDDGVIMLDGEALKLLDAHLKTISPLAGETVLRDAMETRYITVPQLNEMIAPWIRREARKHKLPIPKDWDGKIFDENPIAAMIGYVDNMGEAINAWSYVNALKASGLAITHRTELDMQQIVQKMYSNAVRNASDIEVPHFGQPVPGEVAMAPTSWLRKVANNSNLDGAQVDMALNPKYANFAEDIATNGVQKPVYVSVWEDGSMEILDGHHRLAAAIERGIDQIPVQFRREQVLDPEGNTENALDKLKPGWYGGSEGAAFDDLTAYNADEVFHMLPWGPAPPNLLRQQADEIAGVTPRIQKNLTDNGFKITSLEDAANIRRTAKRVAGSKPGDWAEEVPVDRPPIIGPEERVVAGKAPKDGQWNSLQKPGGSTRHVLNAGKRAIAALDIDPTGVVPKVRIGYAPGTTTAERQFTRRQLATLLEREFNDGLLKDFNTAEGLNQLIDAGLSKTTANALHTFYRDKFGALDSKAAAFVSEEPEEIFQMRMLWDDFRDGVVSMIKNTAGVRDTNGNLITDPEKIRLLGNPEDVEKLRKLNETAEILGANGYDAAVEIMRGTDIRTGVANIEGYVDPGKFNLAGPAIEGLTVHAGIGSYLANVAANMGTIYTPEGIAAAKMASNEVLKWWRAMATLPRPAFHIRNLVGGSWMNMNFGVTSRTMASVNANGIRFRNALRNASGTDSLEKAFEAIPKRHRAAWRAAWEENVMAGFATTEFTDRLAPEAMRGRWDWAKAGDVDNFILTRAGGRVMESVEDFMRMSLFVQHFDEAAGNAKTAAALVNAVHFDYSNLTPMEHRLKSIIPFFVWTRNNLPLQLQLMIENPRYVQRYGHMMQAMNDNFGGNDGTDLEEADHFTAYAAGTSYKVNENTPFWARVMIDPDLPIKDLLNLPNPEPGALFDFANDLLGPHVTTLIDVNKQRELGDVNAPAPLNAIVQGLAAVGMYDRTTDGDVRIPYHLRSLMETVVPFTREVFDPLTGGPTDPNRQQRMGIKEDDDFLTSSAKSMGAQLLGGMGIKFTTPADARAKTYRSEEDIDQLIKELRLQGKAAPIENG